MIIVKSNTTDVFFTFSLEELDAARELVVNLSINTGHLWFLMKIPA